MSFDTYHLWAEIWDASYTSKIGVGPIRLVSASATQELNGVGTGGIETIPLHPDFTIRAMDLLSSKVVVEIWVQTPGSSKRKVQSFIADDVSYSHQVGGLSLSVNGPQTLDLLSNISTLLAREYTGTSQKIVVTSLLTLAGWTLNDNGITNLGGQIDTRFDGQSVLQAIQFINDFGGNRMRESDTVKKELIIGTNDVQSAVRVAFAKGDKPEIRFNTDVVIADNIEVVDDSRDLVNWILPVGAGDGDAAVTLEKATRTSPYTIQTMLGPDSRTLYYLSDSASITTYGQIERRLNFKQIAPIGTSTISLRNSANILYDAAAEWLLRHKDPLQTLHISLRNLQTPLYIGDLIEVQYVETVNIEGVPYTLKNIDGNFYITSINEAVGMTGSEVRIKASNIDRETNNAGKIIVGGLDAIEVNSVSYKPTYNIWSLGPYPEWIESAAGNNPVFHFQISDDVLSVENVTMIIDSYEARYFTYNGPFPIVVGPTQESVIAGTYPDTMTFVVDGTTVLSSYPASSSTQMVAYEIDITDIVVDNGNDGRGQHTVTVTNPLGQGGQIVLQFLIRGTIITGRVT